MARQVRDARNYRKVQSVIVHVQLGVELSDALPRPVFARRQTRGAEDSQTVAHTCLSSGRDRAHSEMASVELVVDGCSDGARAGAGAMSATTIYHAATSIFLSAEMATSAPVALVAASPREPVKSLM